MKNLTLLPQVVEGGAYLLAILEMVGAPFSIYDIFNVSETWAIESSHESKEYSPFAQP
jgi:hypothetical protein